MLRTSLSLSMITGLTFRIRHIRASRPKPGLRPQHLACVKAAAEVCGARVQGATIGSPEILFQPGRIKPGRYIFAIGTAGSTGLLFQTLALPLAFAEGPSELLLEGGTHIPWSPCYHYLKEVYLPALSAMSINMDIRLLKWGFYPKGGGRMLAAIEPGPPSGPFCTSAPDAPPKRVRGLSATARLPEHIRIRQAESAASILERHGLATEFILEEADADSPGTLAFVWIREKARLLGAASLGRRGKPAEEVGRDAALELLKPLTAGACCDRHLSDQLLLPAALSIKASTWTTDAVTSHFKTNAWVISRFLSCRIEYKELASGGYAIRVSPAHFSFRKESRAMD